MRAAKIRRIAIGLFVIVLLLYLQGGAWLKNSEMSSDHWKHPHEVSVSGDGLSLRSLGN